MKIQSVDPNIKIKPYRVTGVSPSVACQKAKERFAAETGYTFGDGTARVFKSDHTGHIVGVMYHMVKTNA